MRRTWGLLVLSAIVGAGLTGCDLFEPPSVTLAYESNFEGTVESVWSVQRTETTPVGSRTFLGPFDNEILNLKLLNLPPHSRVEVVFDLFIMGSWEGNASVDPRGRAVGPDVWRLSVASGPELIQTTFSNVGFIERYDHQAYPDSYPDGDHPARTGADESNSLGYLHNFPDLGVGTRPVDTVYNMTFSFDHDDALLWLVFEASGLTGHTDENWGLDNVTVRLR